MNEDNFPSPLVFEEIFHSRLPCPVFLQATRGQRERLANDEVYGRETMMALMTVTNKKIKNTECIQQFNIKIVAALVPSFRLCIVYSRLFLILFFASK
jgi:hypothetical protein